MKKGKILSILTSLTMMFSLAMPVNAEEGVQILASPGDASFLKEKIESNNNYVIPRNLDFETSVVIEKDTIIDLNGKTISVDRSNPEYFEDDAMFIVKRNATLTIKDSVGGGTITTEGNDKVYSAVKLTQKGESANGNLATLVVESGTLIGRYYAVTGNGTRHDTQITINGGTLKATEKDDSVAIFNPQNGIVNIHGGNLEAATGIVMKRGILNVHSGSINATGTKQAYQSKQDGFYSTGDAIYVEAFDKTTGAPTVTIGGGTIKSTNGKVIASYGETPDFKNNITVSGGRFSSSPIEFIDEDESYIYQFDNEYVIFPNFMDLVTKDESVSVGGKTKLSAYISVRNPNYKRTISYKIISGSDIVSLENDVVTGKKVGKAVLEATVELTKGNAVSKEFNVYVYDTEVKLDTSTNTTKTETTLSNTVAKLIDNAFNDITEVVDEKIAEELKTAVINGKIITTEVKVETIKEDAIDKEQVSKIKELAKDNEVALFLDLSVLLKADNETLGTINELTEEIEFTIDVPEELLKDGRTFYIIRLHNGVAERIDGTLKDGKFTFKTSKFSTYALAYEENLEAAGKEDTKTDKVKTGDNTNTMLYVTLASLALLGCVFILVESKRCR